MIENMKSDFGMPPSVARNVVCLVIQN
jgi:hypothetical protein